MDIVPDTGQLSQVMVQATAPAFILGAVAGFISILSRAELGFDSFIDHCSTALGAALDRAYAAGIDIGRMSAA